MFAQNMSEERGSGRELSTSSSGDREFGQIASSAGTTLVKGVELLVLSVVLRSLLDILGTAGKLLIDTILRKVPLDRLRASSSIAKSRFCTVFRKSGAFNIIQ